MTRLENVYREKVVPVLQKEFAYSSPMQIPGIVKISLNIGLGSASQNNKLMEEAMNELSVIAGQKAVMTRAKKSIAAFKLREGMPIGCRVTLRKERMWDFLDKLMNFALPRVRDFRGINPNAFDGRGNYGLGIKEQLIFPEIEYDKIDKIRGLDVVICTTAKTDEEAKEPDRRSLRPLKEENEMAKKSMILKQQAEPKFSTRRYNRCKICGRPHAYLRDYGICRICFRELAYKGQIPGVKKASW